MRSRRIRDDAGRYQPGPVIDQAVSEGLFSPASEPSLFQYDIEGDGVAIRGLVGVCVAAALVPHEGTVASASDEPAPIVEIRPILALVEESLPRAECVGDLVEAVGADGTRHTLCAVDLDALDLGAPIVADGHHRRRAAIATRGLDATVLTLVIGDAGAGLEAGTFHRIFSGAAALPVAASDVFDVEPVPTPEAVAGTLVWLEGSSGRSFRLTPSPEALSTVRESLRGSPAAVAQALLYPLLGLQEHEAVHVGTVGEAVAGAPPGGGALLLPPVEVGAVIAAARSGTLLPPKASRFSPKPLRGMVLRSVTD